MNAAPSVGKYTFTVNGQPREIETEKDRPLLEVIREDLRLTGTHYGCGEGVCRSCTILVDGRAVASCVMPVSAAQGKSVTTIEGLAKGDELHPVQQAFLDHGALQCGYCTPGMILSLVGLLNESPDPDEQAIKNTMSRNLCRCCGYAKAEAAMKDAVARAKGGVK